LAVWLDGERLAVEAVEAEWRTPTGKAFRVGCTGGRLVTLTYEEKESRWYADA
jgi:hypothetical protein